MCTTGHLLFFGTPASFGDLSATPSLCAECDVRRLTDVVISFSATLFRYEPPADTMQQSIGSVSDQDEGKEPCSPDDQCHVAARDLTTFVLT